MHVGEFAVITDEGFLIPDSFHTFFNDVSLGVFRFSCFIAHDFI